MIRSLYALALLLMPFTYISKFYIGLPYVTWVAPTLVLGLLIAFAGFRSIQPKGSVLLVLWALISGILSFYYMVPDTAYLLFREPARLFLNIIWFWVAIRAFARWPQFTLKWLNVSVIFQMILAVWLWLGTARLLSVPWIEDAFFQSNLMAHQLMSFGDFSMQRLLGTFFESPLFGLFMFSCFIIFFNAFHVLDLRNVHVKSGLYISFMGVVGSLSDQIFLAFLVFLSLIVLMSLKRGVTRVMLLVAVVGLMLLPYTGERIASKVQDTVTATREGQVKGRSGGERMWHALYSLEIIEENPTRLISGIGLGRYGEYATRTNLFPASVTPQVTFVEWLIGSGIVGVGLLVFFFVQVAQPICKQSSSYVGLASLCGLLIANGFQSNWIWSFWFLAVAFLYVAPKLEHSGRYKGFAGI
jgi:hypothetical protein